MLGYVEKIIACGDIETLWKTLAEALEPFGITRLLYGFTRHRSGDHLGDAQDFVMLTTHAPDYIERFFHGGLWHHAPMVRWTLESTGALSWRSIAERAAAGLLTDKEREVYEFNQSQGIVAGYSLSFSHASPRTVGGIGLCAREGMSQDALDEVWDEHGRVIWAMCNVAHLKVLDLPHNGFRRPLTPRQREALEWVGDGKTTQDIAVLMGLTPATVEKHLRLAREALGVETTAQAVLKASVQNQIFRLETGL